MAELSNFQAPNRTVLVEVIDAQGTSGQRDVAEFGRTIAALMNSIGQELETANVEAASGEVVVRFGLSATERGAIALTLGNDAANLQVEFRWSSSGGAPEPDFG